MTPATTLHNFPNLPKPIREKIITFSLNPYHFKPKQFFDLRLVSKAFKDFFDRSHFLHINTENNLKELIEKLKKQTSKILIFALDASHLNITENNIHLFQSFINFSTYLRFLKFHTFSASKELDLSSPKRFQAIEFQKTTNDQEGLKLTPKEYPSFEYSVHPKTYTSPQRNPSHLTYFAQNL